MKKNKEVHKDYYTNANLDLNDCVFLGEGHHGKVFLRKDGKVYKICTTEKSCRKEYEILKRINKSDFFPRAYERKGIYMVRDFVDGQCMREYIKENGMDRKLAVNIIKLLDEFERLGFTKKDTRCKDIYVMKDENIMVIDPKGSYKSYRECPTHLMKGLNKLGVLQYFIEVVIEERPEMYEKWVKSLQENK